MPECSSCLCVHSCALLIPLLTDTAVMYDAIGTHVRELLVCSSTSRTIATADTIQFSQTSSGSQALLFRRNENPGGTEPRPVGSCTWSCTFFASLLQCFFLCAGPAIVGDGISQASQVQSASGESQSGAPSTVVGNSQLIPGLISGRARGLSGTDDSCSACSVLLARNAQQFSWSNAAAQRRDHGQ
jgi:hypothetical protein